MILFITLPHTKCKTNRCFPHVINLAVQAIYTSLKGESNSDIEYLLGNIPEPTEEALRAMALPDGVTLEGYRAALETDIVGMARKLVVACRSSGQRRQEFTLTIKEGNKAQTWTDSKGNPLPLPVLELLRDCETRWSTTFLLLDRVLTLLPVRASQPLWETHSDVIHRQSRRSSHVRNRRIAIYHRSYSIKQKCALQGIFAKSSKSRTSPKNSSPPTKHQHLPSLSPSTIRLFPNGNLNSNNIPSYLGPSRRESRSSNSTLPRLKSHGYMRLRSVCGARRHIAT